MIQLYAHPLSSYCWKVVIALRELGVDYTLAMVDAAHPENAAVFAAHWPLARMPLLVEDGAPVAESSIIIEYLDIRHPGATPLIPAGEPGLRVRFLDRVFDNYVMVPAGDFVRNRIRPDGVPDAWAVDQARALLDRSYAWLDAEGLGPHEWAAGEAFTLADCAALPALFYADKVNPLAGRFPRVSAYLDRLCARPTIARTIADAMPYWPMFPYANG